MTAKLDIAIWSDVMCPWCVIGYKNLEQALARLDGEIDAEIRWLPFELNPSMPPAGEDQDAHVMKKYGRSPDQMAQTRDHIRQLARDAGFAMDWQGEGPAPAAKMWNTRKAHVLLRWALEAHGAEAQTRLKMALFAAHFQQRRDVSDEETLIAIAGEVGLDPQGAASALGDDRLAGVVAWEEDRAQEMNITGVPAMVVNDRLLIPGAQSPETYVNALRQAVARGL